MAERIKIAVTAFGRGVVSFIRPWNHPYEPPKWEPGIGKYFARVGGYISNAEHKFAELHPEALQYAD